MYVKRGKGEELEWDAGNGLQCAQWNDLSMLQARDITTGHYTMLRTILRKA